MTEIEFVATLLPLLCKSGVRNIDENELARKLFYFFRDEKYIELFENISLLRGSLDSRVNINEGLYNEKYIGNSIIWEDGKTLKLCYKDYDKNLWGLKSLSEDGKEKMKDLTNKLALLFKMDNACNKPLYFYETDPNVVHFLVSGRTSIDKVGFNLITDGNIKVIQTRHMDNNNHLYLDPLYYGQYRSLNDGDEAEVLLENASYSIHQGLCNDKITYAIINTKKLDKIYLEKLSKYALQEYPEDKYNLNDSAPYVKKISLK